MRNQQDLREQLGASEKREAELKAKAVDMEEQLRDMTIHFEAQLKILQAQLEGGDGGESELSGGMVFAPVQTPTPRGKRKAKARS
jgi:hypothetical protein